MKIETAEQLFNNELYDIYNAEKQLTKALPKMAKAASDTKLSAGFEKHLRETEGQVERLERIFEILNIKPEKEKCDAMQGLITEGEEFIKKIKEGPVLDAALITAAQKVAHYEIASYGCLCALAKHLGRTDIADILNETLDEEKATDKILNDLAESKINDEAIRQAA